MWIATYGRRRRTDPRRDCRHAGRSGHPQHRADGTARRSRADAAGAAAVSDGADLSQSEAKSLRRVSRDRRRGAAGPRRGRPARSAAGAGHASRTFLVRGWRMRAAGWRFAWNSSTIRPSGPRSTATSSPAEPFATSLASTGPSTPWSKPPSWPRGLAFCRPSKLRTEMARLATPVAKTAGEQERRAFEFLRQYIESRIDPPPARPEAPTSACPESSTSPLPAACTLASGRSAAPGRQFGGVGAMIERPGLAAGDCRRRQFAAAGPLAERAIGVCPPLGRVSSPGIAGVRGSHPRSAAGARRPGNGNAAGPRRGRRAECLVRPAGAVAAGAGPQRRPRPAVGRRHVWFRAWRPDRRAGQSRR